MRLLNISYNNKEDMLILDFIIEITIWYADVTTSVILAADSAADSKSHLIAYNSKSIRPRSKIIIPVERRELVYFIF